MICKCIGGKIDGEVRPVFDALEEGMVVNVIVDKDFDVDRDFGDPLKDAVIETDRYRLVTLWPGIMALVHASLEIPQLAVLLLENYRPKKEEAGG